MQLTEQFDNVTTYGHSFGKRPLLWETFLSLWSLMLSVVAEITKLLTSPKFLVLRTSLIWLIGSSMIIFWLEEGKDPVDRITPKCKNRLGCILGILASWFGSLDSQISLV